MAFFNFIKKAGERIKQEVEILPATFKFLPGEISKTVYKAKSYIPGGELAKGLGETTARFSPQLKRADEQIKANEEKLHNLLIKEIQNSKGNQEKINRLAKIAKQTRIAGPLEVSLEGATTGKQMFASGAELALTAATGLKTKLPIGVTGKLIPQTAIKALQSAKAAKIAESLKGAGIIKKLAVKVGKPLLKESIIGAGFFGAVKTTEKDAKINDIIKAAEMGAIISGGITLGAIGAGAVLEKATQFLKPKISKGLQKAEMGLERIVKGGKPAEIPAIPKNLEQSIAEAKAKGLSAEEFVNKQQDYFYHGTKAISYENIREKGIVPQKRGVSSFSKIEDYARNWSDNQWTKTKGVMFRVRKNVLEGGLVKQKRNIPLTDKQFEVLTNKVVLPNDIEVKTADGWRSLTTNKLSTTKSQLINLYNQATQKQALPAESQLNKTLSYIGEGKATLKQKTAQMILKGAQEASKLKSRFIDRFSPLRRAEKKIEFMAGRPLKETEKVYRNARLASPIADAKAEKLVNEYIPRINQFGDDITLKSKAYLTQLDLIDRARLGQKVAGGQSLDNLINGLEKLTQEIGADDMKKVGQLRQITRNYHKSLLDERIEAGLLNQDQVNRLLETHPNYIPHNVIMDIDEQAVNHLSNSLNVPKTDIMKAVGSVRNIDDPFVATIQRTPIATRTIEKNKVLKGLVEAQEELNLFEGMKQLTTAEKVLKPGENVINLFRQGIKETWIVPEDIAIAVKNLDTPITPGWWKLLTSPQTLLKKGATQYNLSFALPNKFRDQQTAMITADSFIKELAKRTGVSPQAVNLTQKEIKNLYKISGGYGGSIFREGDDKIFNQLSKVGVKKYSQYLNPAKTIEAINESLEQSTRMQVFRKGLEAGLSPKDAALASRDATIDFAKMGTWMRPINQAVPFLNARVQGFINLPKAFVNNPEVFARMQMYTAVYPTIALQANNRRFESFKNISQYYKDKYWIIMTGENKAIDEYSGEPILVPQFITIPKGEGQTLVSGPIQYYLDKSDEIDYRKNSEMIADVLGSASPLEFQTWGEGNIWLTGISQLGPLASIVVGLGTNIQPYSGQKIVAESRKQAPKELQFKKTTPEITKEIAKILNASPAEVEFVLNSFGGLPQDVQQAADIIYNVARNGKIGGNALTETSLGALTQIPISRRFIRESIPSYGPETQFREKQKEELETEIIGQKLQIKDKAEQVFIEMNKRKTKDEKIQYLNSLGDELTPEIRKKIKSLKDSRQGIEVLKKTDSVELRARYILQRLDEQKEQGIKKEDRIKFLNDLEKSEILTLAVKEMIEKLKNQY